MIKRLTIILIAVAIVCVLLLKIIPFKKLDDFIDRRYSVVIKDRNSQTLNVIPLKDGLRREFIPYEDIPQEIISIFMQSEDKRFYFHYGVDIFSIFRAFYQNISENRLISGGSTITMQLASIIQNYRPTYSDKILEIIDAVRIEAKLSKKEIIELWLNSIPFGNNCEGIASASKVIFGKPISRLTSEEALMLSIIPRRPEKYNTSTPDSLVHTAYILSNKMGYNKTPAMFKEAIDNIKNYNYKYEAAHFVEYIKKYHASTINQNKCSIITSLNLDLNHFIESHMNYYLNEYRENRLSNSSVMVMDNHTGEILAYVGSSDFNNEKYSGQIDGVQITNQPGSTLKPFLYAYAFENGLLASDILPDIPMDFGSEEVYMPQNFDRRFHGPIRVRVALASSLNVPAVYTVVKYGVRNFTNKLISMGFDSLRKVKDTAGSNIALGGEEVSLFELVRAFSVFSRGGTMIEPSFFKMQTYEEPLENRIFSEYTSYLICDILSDNKSRALGFGLNTVLDTKFNAIFKTGTSNQFNNIWALGSTVDITVGVWMGNFAGQTVIGRTGSSLPAQLASDVLYNLTDQKSGQKDFPAPPDTKKIKICTLSGKAATSLCNSTTYEYIPDNHDLSPCDYHIISNNEIKTVLPPIYSSWSKENSTNHPGKIKDDNQNETELYFLRPNNNSVFYYDSSISNDAQSIIFKVFCNKYDKRIRVSYNSEFIKLIRYPYTFEIPLERGNNTVTINLENLQKSINFTVY